MLRFKLVPQGCDTSPVFNLGFASVLGAAKVAQKCVPHPITRSTPSIAIRDHEGSRPNDVETLDAALHHELDSFMSQQGKTTIRSVASQDHAVRYRRPPSFPLLNVTGCNQPEAVVNRNTSKDDFWPVAPFQNLH